MGTTGRKEEDVVEWKPQEVRIQTVERLEAEGTRHEDRRESRVEIGVCTNEGINGQRRRRQEDPVPLESIQ
jgi:hypothetical protein